ncbi:hypothetical protein NE477_26200, partial [Blautia marasmi]|nr:hypothetical protein [Blautia marasmi]
RVLIMPVRLIGFSACHLDKKTVWGKYLFVVGKLQGTGKDFQYPLSLRHLEYRHRKIPVENSLGCPVLKTSVS